MSSDEDLLKQLRTSRVASNLSLCSEERINAFRRQSILLEEITKSSTEHDRASLYKSLLKERNTADDTTYQSFIDDRCKNVQKMLEGLCCNPPRTSLSAKEYLMEHKLKLEPECSGKYQSCAKSEVNLDDLKVFKNVLGEAPAMNRIQSPPRKVLRADVPKTENVNPANTRQLNINPFFTKAPVVQEPMKTSAFRTAREELIIQNAKKHGDPGSSRALFNYGASKKSLGARRNVRSGFVPPIRPEDNVSPTCTPPDATASTSTESIDERLRNIDPKMIELISNEIMHKFKPIGWYDIAGLEYAKSTIKEAVVWPLLRPDIFTGLRRPPRGILLFGPPGTGKTLIGKCIASQSKSTFFSISASSLTSKWVGDAEKMVRALFAVAAVNQPSVVFIDEIDSLLSQRSGTEHESSRRLKTEFLVQLDGANTAEEERILIVGATNRPQELDEAARRRLVRRLYIPLPELSARKQILTNLLHTVRNSMGEEDIVDIAKHTSGYSGADMETLCREASMEPIRSIPPDEIAIFNEANVRPVNLEDFRSALLRVRPSVSQVDLQQYADWNRLYGAGH